MSRYLVWYDLKKKWNPNKYVEIIQNMYEHATTGVWAMCEEKRPSKS